jgi:predicted CXXCH cytochrome family protein
MGKSTRKKTTIKLAVSLLLAMLGFSTSASAGIQGSAHDFSNPAHAGWSGGQICQPCHTPHNAKQGLAIRIATLWSHQLSAANYTLYSSDTLDTTPEQPRGTSKLCLSCHDGTIALDSFGAEAGGSNFIPSGADLTTNLSDDHPISIIWTHQTLAGVPSDEKCYYCHDNIGEDPAEFRLPFYEYNGHTTGLYDAYLECSSCHDPHNNGDNGADAQPFLLRMSNAGSALCLQCHYK